MYTEFTKFQDIDELNEFFKKYELNINDTTISVVFHDRFIIVQQQIEL